MNTDRLLDENIFEANQVLRYLEDYNLENDLPALGAVNHCLREAKDILFGIAVDEDLFSAWQRRDNERERY